MRHAPQSKGGVVAPRSSWVFRVSVLLGQLLVVAVFVWLFVALRTTLFPSPPAERQVPSSEGVTDLWVDSSRHRDIM